MLNKDNYFSKRREMSNLIGEAITTWAYIEAMLLNHFAQSLRISPRRAANILIHVKSFSLLLSIVDAATKDALDGDPEIVHWNSLVEYARELSGDRNFIAHTPMSDDAPILFETDGLVGHDWNKAEPKIGPSLSTQLAKNERIPPMDAQEIWELNADFRQAENALRDFLKYRISPDPSQSKFREPISRRRPSRKLRLEESRKGS